MPAVKNILLAAAMTALTAPAWAALTYTASGAWNLATSSSAGSTPVSTSTCGIFGQQGALFDGAGDDNVGIHAYSCDDSLSNFGSRASGENTFYAQSIASIIGSVVVAEGGSFSIFINPGEVGAFGSTAFGVDDFQKSRLSIQLLIDGKAYLDEAWSAEVLAGGVSNGSHTSTGSHNVAFNFNDGADYFSYGFAGGGYTIDLTAGAHDVSYVMTAEAWGQVAAPGICTGYLQRLEGASAAAPVGEAFTAYCGAGARSGDPFNDPIARVQEVDTPLPEPMTAGLAVTALLAAAGARRRAKR